ncbi:GTP-binding protein, partial [Candidatus Microgenomates bacterium CPR3]|nr:GTP-binding protein [Candidatus Microgenomates bacterium CPR3]
MTNSRPPIIAILGHVDHGKTTLLDYIRSSHIAVKEAGGITQSIGAYQANFKDHTLTFIDTPGHAAFAKMRSRGASVADIAVLVVAADDGVMPQTAESIKYIQAAKIPFVVAINKTDKPQANPELPKAQLTEHQVFVEGYGGNTPFVLISGKTGAGVDQLLETLLLLAELEELKNDASAPLQAPIIESKLDMKRGVLVSAIVKEGTLKTSDTVYVGGVASKIRSIISYAGTQIPTATPGTPVQLLGFNTVPYVGQVITDQPVSPDEAEADASGIAKVAPMPANRLKLIVRTDSLGSLEALRSSFTDEIQVIEAGTGDVSESDVLLARTTGSLILAFAVRIPSSVAKLAELEGVVIKSYKIIYELLEYLEKKILRLMEPTIDEDQLGKGVIIKVFD